MYKRIKFLKVAGQSLNRSKREVLKGDVDAFSYFN
jgi:16S rRNA G527 N7-methylase RsmG